MNDDLSVTDYNGFLIKYVNWVNRIILKKRYTYKVSKSNEVTNLTFCIQKVFNLQVVSLKEWRVIMMIGNQVR